MQGHVAVKLSIKVVIKLQLGVKSSPFIMEDVRCPNLLYDVWELKKKEKKRKWHFCFCRSTVKMTVECWKETGQGLSKKVFIPPRGLGVETSWDSGPWLISDQSSMDNAGYLQLSCAQVITPWWFQMGSDFWFHWSVPRLSNSLSWLTSYQLWLHTELFLPWRNVELLSSVCKYLCLCFNYIFQSWEFLAFLAASSPTTTLPTTPTRTLWLRSTTTKKGRSWITAMTVYGQ